MRRSGPLLPMSQIGGNTGLHLLGLTGRGDGAVGSLHQLHSDHFFVRDIDQKMIGDGPRINRYDSRDRVQGINQRLSLGRTAFSTQHDSHAGRSRSRRSGEQYSGCQCGQ